jgi:hypothetical protein
MKINLKKLNILFIILVTMMLFNSASFGYASQKTDLPKYAVTEDEKFNKVFREGRDLIDKEDWKKAAEKFKEIACDCPEDKYVDAALYWLAFCQKKQKSFNEMDKTLDILLRNYPSSSWADDARVMKYEQLSAVYSNASRPTVVRKIPIEVTASTLLSIYSQTPLDREDEIKLAAFQSLLSANPQRAIEIMGDMIRTDSKASETLKREIIRNLRMPRFSAFAGLSGYPAYEVPVSKAKNQYVSQLREALVKGYQNDSNIKVRTEIIYALASINDVESNNYISQLYSSEQNKELKKAIINSFGISNYPTFSAQSANLKSSDKANFDKLLEVVRTRFRIATFGTFQFAKIFGLVS